MKLKNGKVMTIFSLATAGMLMALSGSLSGATISKPLANHINRLSEYTVSEDLSKKGQYGADFNSFDEAEAAADVLNKQLSEEGNALLKNDGSIPLNKGAAVSMFGVATVSGAGSSDSGGTTSITLKDSLEDAGFHVNPTLSEYYTNKKAANTLSEVASFPRTVANSIDLYNEVGVVMLARSGGEGNDESRNTGEDSDPGEHENEVTGKKHALELSDAEQDLITYAENHCHKVVIVLNSSYVMEMGGLQDDDQVNGILWVGLTGETGLEAVGEFLVGSVNPSGRSVDVWARDFTKDPTWFNFGDNSQVGITDGDVYYYSDGKATGNSRSEGFGYPGYHGVDNEEGIYLGYKYYETRYKAIADALGTAKADAWYKANVVYPFGYGTGFSKFSFAMGDLYTDSACTTALGASVANTKFASAVGAEAAIKSIYVPVTVTNTGSVAGKQTVQIYVTAPYTTGEIEKSFVVLAGFDKTEILAPGASEKLVIKVNAQDFASYDYLDSNNNSNKGYELDAGTYTIRAMDNSHVELGGSYGDHPYAEKTFDITGGVANLKLDDFSGKEVSNKLSSENGIYDSFRENVNETNDDPMTLLSRKDMGAEADSGVASFPKKPTTAGRTFKASFTDRVIKYDAYDADNTDNYSDYDDTTKATAEGWADDVNIPATWTQAATTADSNTTKMRDMAGVSLDTTEGKTKWEAFMNQLSWDEIKTVLQNGGYKTASVPSIDKAAGVDSDGPGNLNSTHDWCDEPTIASTFNRVLAKREGIIMANLAMYKGVTGWYGPGADIHRSPFSGRNGQYYSQDGFQGGEIGAAVVGGAESRGLVCYIKHFAANDMETCRDGEVHFTWMSEQSLRENQLKQFQIPMQEGNASGAMTAFARIGSVPSSANYNLLTGITRDEWDWKGYYVTDGYNGTERCASLDLMIRTGQDMPLGIYGITGYPAIMDWDILLDYNEGNKITVKSPRDVSGVWDATLRSGKGGIKVGNVSMQTYSKTGLHTYDIATVTTPEKENEAQYYFARTCAMRILYNQANSTDNQNGTQPKKYAGADLGTIAQGTPVTNLSVKAADTVLNGSEGTYTLKSGELPTGLTISSDGTISGTPSGKVGTYTFTIGLNIDSWISSSATFTIEVGTAFKWDGDDLAGAKVGTEFSGYVSSDTVKTAITGTMATPGGEVINLGTTVSYGLAEDSHLPDGLTIGSDGLISGTPSKEGTYSFSVKVTAVTTGGWGNPGGTVYYYYDMTIIVAAKPSSGDTSSSTSQPTTSEPSTSQPSTSQPSTSTPTSSTATTNNADLSKATAFGVAGTILGIIAIAGCGVLVYLVLGKHKKQ